MSRLYIDIRSSVIPDNVFRRDAGNELRKLVANLEASVTQEDKLVEFIRLIQAGADTSAIESAISLAAI